MPLRATALPLATAIFACLSPAHAETPASTGTLEEVIVTAQKRTESLQNVPVSITALGTQKLEELHLESINDYIKYLPSVSYQSSGPGFAKIYMRGVSSGGDGNHSGSLPSVGVYLDEQPITTIQGPLDIHVYDIARVEALAGPQGTLYGASSEAGTIRIITNKPEFNKFSAAYDLQGNTVKNGDPGYSAEGYRQYTPGLLRGDSLGRLVRKGRRLYRQRPGIVDLSGLRGSTAGLGLRVHQ